MKLAARKRAVPYSNRLQPSAASSVTHWGLGPGAWDLGLRFREYWQATCTHSRSRSQCTVPRPALRSARASGQRGGLRAENLNIGGMNFDIRTADGSFAMLRGSSGNYTVKIYRHLTIKILTTFSSGENDDKSLSVDDTFVICDDRFVT